MNQWSHTASLREQYYADHGYLVVRVDNRGSYRRGHAFEAAIYEHLGSVEVEDYVTVLEHLINIGIVDSRNIAIYGWSYGGYISLMAIAKAPHIFKCAISGAPVTAWDGYDTYYTGKPAFLSRTRESSICVILEKYMNHPEKNPAGYVDSMVMTHAHKITGR